MATSYKQKFKNTYMTSETDSRMNMDFKSIAQIIEELLDVHLEDIPVLEVESKSILEDTK